MLSFGVGEDITWSDTIWLTFLDDNLYIGTSASEVLHLVRLPGETEYDEPQFILASRLAPSGHAHAQESYAVGVQQILILPGSSKACILCNGIASFYTLPELSPAFPNSQPSNVQWIGGIDENESRDDPSGTTIMVATSKQITQVRVGERLKRTQAINYPGCLGSRRRGTIACVADDKSYALIETEHQQQIPLFEISSAPETSSRPGDGSPPRDDYHSHSRSVSLGAAVSLGAGRDPSPGTTDLDSSNSPGSASGANSRLTNRPRSATEVNGSKPHLAYPRSPRTLKPHILSPSPNEFMLTTGTSMSEPGVGMFVNLDGDVTRGTLQFDSYPYAIIDYSFSAGETAHSETSESEYVLALINLGEASSLSMSLEIIDIRSSSDSAGHKVSLKLPESSVALSAVQIGLTKCLGKHSYFHKEIPELLRAVKYHLGSTTDDAVVQDMPDEDERRSAEETQVVQRLAKAGSQVLIWRHDTLWQVVPNPALLELEAALLDAISLADGSYDFSQINMTAIMSLLGRLRQKEPVEELEFRAYNYIRQKASVVLLLHLLSTMKNDRAKSSMFTIIESALLEGGVDPRVVLSILAPIREEIRFGRDGLWLQQGIVDCLIEFDVPMVEFSDAPQEFWLMIRHYLTTWQEKRGFASISDEKAVFDTVDAALLHVLLQLDTASPRGGQQTAIGLKLNNVVDHWKGDFDRAVTLLERYRRLFLLSRLYQSRKASREVLSTWKRICEGEQDADASIQAHDLLLQMRRYLTVIRDSELVKDYAIWLAKKSPDLAVQLLSDANSRTKFDPAEVVSLLKSHAPSSVQLFLEHLVFAKGLDQYADDLVGYYLDSVLNVLESSTEARQSLADSYSTYRALESPKPTYFGFITENAPSQPWWQSRIRLLQLLGSGGYATSGTTGKELTYSIEKVLERLQPYSSYLVSESIILDARQGRHEDALRLLVHGLGDYDTAVRYCYFGGPSAPSGTIDISLLPSREQQQDLFTVLFDEFLKIDDPEDRIERASHLLGTFATYFDPLRVLEQIPESWSISALSEFLTRTFRAATTERNQAVVIKALSAAQNLQRQAEYISVCEKLGAVLQNEDGGGIGKSVTGET